MTMISGPGIDLLQPAQQRDAVEVGQHQVGDDDVGAPLLEDLLAAGADERRPDLVALGLDDHLEPLGHRRLVVDGEYAFAALAVADEEVAIVYVSESVNLPYGVCEPYSRRDTHAKS